MTNRDEALVLTKRETEVLRLRLQKPPMSYSLISRELDITTTRVWQLVKALREKGLMV